MKNLIKSIIFLTILIIILSYVFKILWLPKNPIAYSYDEPKNSSDIVYIGSSNAYSHFNTVLAYNMYGFTTNMLSADSQPFELVEYLIKESRKYQNPKLYIIDITKVLNNINDFSDEDIRKTIDVMSFSQNRKDAIDKILKERNSSKDDYINFYFSFLLYHNSWKNINKDNFIESTKYFKGYVLGYSQTSIEEQKEYIWNNNLSDLPKENQETLLSLISYVKKNDLNVLFVIPKRSFSELEQMRLNKAKSIIEEDNLNVINFNTFESLDNIDFKTDFYNFAHLNVYGATKYTLCFSKYLKENYDLPDHRKEKEYESWNSEFKRMKEQYNLLTGKDYDELLNLLNNY